ncbi:MAG: hypothetical protein H0U73_01950 [Tatlockia sp.]|nr:hypothetical protein [Tatlockia sp.]
METKWDLEQNIKSTKQKIATLKIKPIKMVTQTFLQQMNIVGDAIIELLTSAHKHSLLRPIFEDFIAEPKSWLIPIEDVVTHKQTLLLPYLEECACTDGNAFNRYKNDRREQIENSIIQFAQNRFNKTSPTTINYLSLGSGYLLQDFFIIVKLMLEGYSVVVSLVDPIYSKSVRANQALKQFEFLMLAATEMNLSVTIRSFPNIEEFNRSVNTPQDLVTAIDFDDIYGAFNDLMLAQESLHSKGRMFLACKDENYIFSKDKCIQSPALDNNANILDNLPLTQKNALNIAILSPTNFNVMPIISSLLIPYLSNHNTVKTINLVIPQGLVINESFGSRLNISKNALTNFMNLFLPIEINIEYIAGNVDFITLLSQYHDEQDLVICSNQNMNGSKAILEDISKLHEKFPQANLYCGMQGYQKRGTTNIPSMTFNCQWIWNSLQQSIKIFKYDNELTKALITQHYKNNHPKEQFSIEMEKCFTESSKSSQTQ